MTDNKAPPLFDEPDISLTLRMPPGINESHTVSRGKIILTTKARDWRQEAQWQVAVQRQGVTLPYRFACLIVLPDNRKFDIEAGAKALLDACEKGLAVTNDKHCRDFHIVYDETREDDSVLVELRALPDVMPEKRKTRKKSVA